MNAFCALRHARFFLGGFCHISRWPSSELRAGVLAAVRRGASLEVPCAVGGNDSQHLAKAAGAVIMSTSQIRSFRIMGNATCAHQGVK